MFTTYSNSNMNTRITDLAFLGTSTMAGLTGLVHSYGGFLITAASALLLAIIRVQQHRQKMRHTEEIHQEKITQLQNKK